MASTDRDAYLGEIFPAEVLGFKRPAEPVPQDWDFSTQFPQFITTDPVGHPLINAVIRQAMSNDNLLKGWTDQLFDAIAKQDFDIVTALKKGVMTPEMLNKLNGIAAGANNYSHPSTHPATMITQDGTHRFATDAEKSTWNSKADKTVASTTADGLCPKRNGSTASFLRGDGTWQTPPGTYSHPATHAATMITQDATHRFVSDTEKSTWNGKASTAVATQSANGLFLAADKKKLDGIAAGANAYSHPSSHPGSMITQDSTHRFVSDTEKTAWNAKANTNSPALTGTPTAPTASTSTNNTQLATTAFVKAAITSGGGGIVAASLNQNGYVKFANGLILQWGGHSTTGHQIISFPIAFSSICYTAYVTIRASGYASYPGTGMSYAVYDHSPTQLRISFYHSNGSHGGVNWLAIGR